MHTGVPPAAGGSAPGRRSCWHTSPIDGPVILHVDMDAFYAAVEVLADPSLAGRPVIVGGAGARGVVASCSYEARSYGIHSAMPSARARRLCPHAVFVHGRYDLYQDYSRRLHAVLTSFTPLVEGIALDEAFLDVTGARRLWGTGAEIAACIRARVFDDTGLRCSVGVAPSKFLAKLASEAAKPRAGPPGAPPTAGLGVKVVEPGGELGFLHPHPVGALWGVGPATRRRLDRFGIRTVGDLAAMSLATLVGALGEAHGRHLHALAWARDDRAVEPDRAAKSVGHEETYATDHHRLATLREEALRLSDAVANRLREAGTAGRTVTVKVRFATFQTITRSRTVPAPVDSGPAIARVATELLEAVDPSPGVRLLGVSVSNLAPRPGEQLRLGEEAAGPADREPAVARAVDEVRRRFGDSSVGPATLLRGEGLAVKRRGDQQWGPEAGRD
ncbi:MAG TPA: DNA polymerase IV [Acidimicrobiales bacterium]|nr:DNA polymerase IV [Acidimicrobiales bacterium]